MNLKKYTMFMLCCVPFFAIVARLSPPTYRDTIFVLHVAILVCSVGATVGAGLLYLEWERKKSMKRMEEILTGNPRLANEPKIQFLLATGRLPTSRKDKRKRKS